MHIWKALDMKNKNSSTKKIKFRSLKLSDIKHSWTFKEILGEIFVTPTSRNNLIQCHVVNPNRFLFLLDSNPWITVTLAMIGKFQIAASFAVIYVYAGELMPTVVRSEAMGISSFVAGIGLLLFPYINALVSHYFLSN